MKIAILLTGLVRDYENNYTDIFEKFVRPNILGGHEIDIFICTWDIRGMYKTVKVYVGGDVDTKTDYLSHDKFDVNDLVNKYKPKKYLILDQAKFRKDVWQTVVNFAKKYNTEDYNRIFGCLYSQFYTVKKAFELMEAYEKEHNFTYDYVVRHRFDMMYTEPFLLNTVILRDNRIFVVHPIKKPSGYKNHVYSTFRYCSMIVPIGYTDSYALGKRDVIKIYCSFYDILNRIKRENFDTERDGREVLYTEFLLTYAMQKYYNFEYEIMDPVHTYLAR